MARLLYTHRNGKTQNCEKPTTMVHSSYRFATVPARRPKDRKKAFLSGCWDLLCSPAANPALPHTQAHAQTTHDQHMNESAPSVLPFAS